MQLLGEHYVSSERDFLALNAIAATADPTTDSGALKVVIAAQCGSTAWQGCSCEHEQKPKKAGQRGSRRDENELAGMTVLGLD